MSQTEVLAELKDTLAEAGNESAAENKNLLCEDPNAFSLDSMSFEDCTAAIMEQTEELFAVTRLCDRFAPQYLKFCKTLERSVNHLGGAFITKTAIHANYNTFDPKLSALSVEHLYRMISYNFRKCNAALKESSRIHKEFDLDLYNQMLSFASVMDRLRSTQQRAYDINIWKEDPEKYIRRKNAFTEKDKNKRYTDKQGAAAPFREAPSYAIDYDVVAQYQQRSENSACEDSETAETTTAPETAGQEMITSDETETTAIAVSDEKPIDEPYVPDEPFETFEQFCKRLDAEGFDEAAKECLEILQTAAGRGEQDKTAPDDPRPSYSFTEEEMIKLMGNKVFPDLYPGLANDIGNYLNEMALSQHDP